MRSFQIKRVNIFVHTDALTTGLPPGVGRHFILTYTRAWLPGVP
jgi:hypothetical protein